ncbi:MAG: hypothetical protein ACUVWX_12235 [Kiritimatiellia bacterium]
MPCILFLLALAAVGTEEIICFEAESAERVVPPVEVVRAKHPSSPEVAEASSGSCLAIPQGKGNPPEVGGEALFRFEVMKEGQYALWARVWWNDECGNSATMIIDEGKPFTFGQDSTFKCWHWVRAPRVKELYLKTGQHTLTIKNREDGIRLDQILFCLNPRFVPVGIERSTVRQVRVERAQ